MPQLFNNKFQFPFYAKLCMTLISLALMVLFLYVGSTLFVPIIFGTLIALLLYPLSRFFERMMPRSIASFLALLVFILVITAFVFLFSTQATSFATDIPNFKQRILLDTNYIQKYLAHKFGINAHKQTEYLNNMMQNSLGAATAYLQNALLYLTELIIWVIFVIIYTYFILFYRSLLVKFVIKLFNETQQPKVQSVLAKGRVVINRYILGLLIEMLIVAILVASVLSIIGVKYVLLLSILIAVLNVVPYIGIYSGMVVSMLIAFSYSGGNMALEVGVAIVGVHLIDSNIVMPRIVGSQVKINALMTIVAVFAGHLLWGVAGMFLFVPLTAIFKIVAEHLPELEPWALLLGSTARKKKDSSINSEQIN